MFREFFFLQNYKIKKIKKKIINGPKLNFLIINLSDSLSVYMIVGNTVSVWRVCEVDRVKIRGYVQKNTVHSTMK